MFEVFLTNRAEKGIKSLDEIKLRRRIDTYFPKRYGIKKLKGVKNTYRLRIGDYRIIYTANFNNSQIFVLSITSRKKAY
jgi:mRNA interferase RelE/StbE